MKKYYNEKGEQLKLQKGTIKEIKDYLGNTTIYLTQDENTKIWRMTFAQGWIEENGKQTWNRRIPLGVDTTEAIADWLGYLFDEGDDIKEIVKETNKELNNFINELNN